MASGPRRYLRPEPVHIGSVQAVWPGSHPVRTYCRRHESGGPRGHWWRSPGAPAEPSSSVSSPESPGSSAALEDSPTSPVPVVVPAMEQARKLATAGRPDSAVLSIPALDLRGVRVRAVRRHARRPPRHRDPGRRRPGRAARRRWPRRPRWPRQLPGHRPPHVVDPTVRRPASAASRCSRRGRDPHPPPRLRDHPHPLDVVPPSVVAPRPVLRSPRPPRPRSDPRDDHAVDLRHPRGPRGGNYWADELHNPEHRIDKIGVLRSLRRL